MHVRDVEVSDDRWVPGLLVQLRSVVVSNAGTPLATALDMWCTMLDREPALVNEEESALYQAWRGNRDGE